MDIQTLAQETARAESDARAANVRALRALVDLVRPVAGVIAAGRSAVLGRSEWEGDDPVTLDTEESITILDWHDDVTHDTGSGCGCGDTEGFVLILRADGSLWSAETSGRYWSGRGGGELWRAHDLAPTTVEGIAARVSAETIARSLYEMLVARKGKARGLAWRRQRLAQALAAVSQPA